MSGTLIETKKKIGSFKNTRKMTKAMELVAASKMRNFQRRAVSTRVFAWDLVKLLQADFPAFTTHSLVQERASGTKLFIIYTSDKGLCGGMNTNVLKALFGSQEWLQCAANERLLITFGKKGFAYTQFKHIPVLKHYESVPEKMTTVEALQFVHEILSVWNDYKCQKVYMVTPHYKNAFTYYAKVRTFLPFSLDSLSTLIEPADVENKHFMLKTDYMLYEPSAEQVVDTIVNQLIFSIFFTAFLELKATEYSSRMIAMKNATDATDRMLETLTLTLNQARQQAITAELADLINSSEAMSES